MKKLKPTTAMSREEIAEGREILGRIGTAIGDLPHSKAVGVLCDIKDLEDLICEALPGGYLGKCEACDVVLGNDDDVTTGGEDCLDFAPTVLKNGTGKMQHDRTKGSGRMTIKVGDCSVTGCRNKNVRICRGWCMPHYDRWRKYGDPTGGGCLKGDPQYFLETVALPFVGSDCLMWPYARGGNGYAQAQIDGRLTYVHRHICRKVCGEPPTLQHEAAHGCVNPAHLSWKTPAENQADRTIHGTSNRGERQWLSRLTERAVMDIRSSKQAAKNLADKYDVHVATIHSVRRGATWGWLNEETYRKALEV